MHHNEHEICTMDERGLCQQCEKYHVGKERDYALADTDEGRMWRKIWRNTLAEKKKQDVFNNKQMMLREKLMKKAGGGCGCRGNKQ